MGIWAAGGLSSRFIAGSDEVQALPRSCGWMKEVSLTNLSDSATFETANAQMVIARVGYRRIASYSRSCYGLTPADNISSSCESYIQASLPYNVSTNDPYPFGEKICSGQSITLDTGLLRSDTHLGINTRPEDAMIFRKVLSCVPLAGESYTQGWHPAREDTSFGKTGTLLKAYAFGHNHRYVPVSNLTFEVSDAMIELGDQPYNVDSASALVNHDGDETIMFDPIPELRSPEADVNVVSVLNRVSYRSAVKDPWFNAQNCTNSSDWTSPTLCTASNPLTFLGCQERDQLCTSEGNSCSPLIGLYGIDRDLQRHPNLNPTQQALFQLLWKIMWFTRLDFQIAFVGIENLLAWEYLWWDAGGLSATLPSDQWQREVRNWMNTSLAALQYVTYGFARPPVFDVGPGIAALQYVVEPEDPTMRLICHKIKARSKAHTSFSVLGLFLTLALGLLIIILDLSLPSIVSYVQKRSGKGLHKRLEWIESSAFQLQRMAAEGRGIEPWNGKENDVPTLAEHGHLFNLTSLSLRRIHSQTSSYEDVGKASRAPEE